MNSLNQLISKYFPSGGDQNNNFLPKVVLPIFSIIVAILLAVFVIGPQLIQYSKTQKQISELNDNISALESKAQTLGSIPVENYQAGFDVALKALPGERDFIISSAQLQLIAASANVSLDSISFSDLGTADHYQIKFEATGSLAAMVDLFSKIDKAPRLMKIAAVELSSDKANVYSTSVTVNTYILPLTKGVTPGEPPASLTQQDQAQLATLSQSLTSLSSVIQRGSNNPVGRVDPFQ